MFWKQRVSHGKDFICELIRGAARRLKCGIRGYAECQYAPDIGIYLSGVLSPPRALQVGEHLRACMVCKGRVSWHETACRSAGSAENRKYANRESFNDGQSF